MQIILCAGNLIGTAACIVLVPRLGTHGTTFLGVALLIVSNLVIPMTDYIFSETLPIWGACIVCFVYMFGNQLFYNNIMHICMGATPTKDLQASVQSILLACGTGGGMLGTVGSNILYGWNGKPGVDLANVGCQILNLICVGILWGFHAKIANDPIVADIREREERGELVTAKEKKKVRRMTEEIRGFVTPHMRRSRRYRTLKAPVWNKVKVPTVQFQRKKPGHFGIGVS